MSRMTITKLNGMKRGKLSERVGARGDGALLFECNNKGLKEAYYRYRTGGVDTRIKIGNYLYKGVGLSLKEIRNKAVELASLKISHPNLKGYLLEEKVRVHDLQKKQDLDGRLGTFEELLSVYVAHLKKQKKVSANNVEYHLNLYVLSSFPLLRSKLAKDMETADVVDILRRMLKKGVTTGVNRVRSYLCAAFNYTIRGQNDPRQRNEHGKCFNLKTNPVEEVPLQRDYERVRERVLSDEEIVKLWLNIDVTPCVGVLTSCAVKLVIACGGQRPKQLLACRWSDYDFNKRTVTILDAKGNRRRKHVVPLTDTALEILQDVKKITADLIWPFTYTGRGPVSVNSVSTAIRRYIKHNNSEHFMLKDLRRTCKRLMIDALIVRDTRNLIQGHALTGIDFKHYDHNDHLLEKNEGLETFTNHLGDLVGMQKDNKAYAFKESVNDFGACK